MERLQICRLDCPLKRIAATCAHQDVCPRTRPGCLMWSVLCWWLCDGASGPLHLYGFRACSCVARARSCFVGFLIARSGSSSVLILLRLLEPPGFFVICRVLCDRRQLVQAKDSVVVGQGFVKGVREAMCSLCSESGIRSEVPDELAPSETIRVTKQPLGVKCSCNSVGLTQRPQLAIYDESSEWGKPKHEVIWQLHFSETPLPFF